MEWNEEAIERLRTLWAEGHSTAEIGRRMVISKNAVVGKAHRLGLVARPSPLRREMAPNEPRPPERTAPERTVPERPVVAAVPPPPVRAAPARSLRSSACCWPIGEPGTPSFRFCDGDALAGKPYCAEHAQLAYVKVRDRREEAA